MNVGDLVKVIEGDLRNLIGVVIDHTDKQVTILPKEIEINEPVSFLPTQLIKHFKLGDKVKLTEGSYHGQQGTILKLDDKVAGVIVDNINQEIKCLVNTLDVCVESKQDNKTFLNYKKLDLVRLIGGQRAGVILSIEKNFLTILNDQVTL